MRMENFLLAIFCSWFSLTIMYFLDFAEKLYKKLEGCREKFDVRVMLMNLISRLIGIHKALIDIDKMFEF